jgi:S-formylglutathione hydrolase FrmB
LHGYPNNEKESMHRPDVAYRGRLHRLVLDSRVLEDNPLNDPATRELFVYTPAQATRGLPLLVDLPGFNSAGPDHVNRRNIGENVPERLDRLIGSGAMPPCVVAFPDCMTALGGNQYINSVGTGRYMDYLVDEVLPFVENAFGCGGSGRRGVFGKSSGGFGALWHGMTRPDVWSAVACNSGDMDFEAVYRAGIYAAVRTLERWDGSAERFFSYFDKAAKVTPEERSCRMHLALAATYDPDPQAWRGIRLPCDLRTGEFNARRWDAWLAHDPVLAPDATLRRLGRLSALWIDCGSRDQYFLNLGARRLCERLSRLGIDHVHEEFPDEHLDVDYRMDRFLPVLAGALGA